MKASSLAVLARGQHWIAVDKPSGLSTVAPPGGDSLERRLREQLAEVVYLTAVHRLDRPVSGVVLLALSKRAARLLSAQFESRKVQKRYHACLSGHWPSRQSVWEDDLVKRPKEARVDIVAAGTPEAKRAVTRVALDHYDPTLDRTSVWLSPLTGRMHQLRVQAASRGYPIVGDRLYSAESVSSVEAEKDQIALRAIELTFFDPRNGRRTTVNAAPNID